MLDKINPTKTESWKKLKNLGSISDLKILFKMILTDQKNTHFQTMDFLLIFQKT